jgi:hypothetical protein
MIRGEVCCQKLPVKLGRITELHRHLLYHHHYGTGPQVQKRSHKHLTPIIQTSPKGRPKRTGSGLSVMMIQQQVLQHNYHTFFSNTFFLEK